jgi:hypothetical protein
MEVDCIVEGTSLHVEAGFAWLDLWGERLEP